MSAAAPGISQLSFTDSGAFYFGAHRNPGFEKLLPLKGRSMKIARVLLFSALLLVMAAGASAEVQGWGLGAGLVDGDFGVQARKDIWLGGDISQFTAQGGVFFASTTIFRLDADYHFIINSKQPSRFYPLGGLNFSFTSDHAKFGLNLGGGVNFRLTEKTQAFAELKYIISDWDGFGVVVGIYF